ncbi:MAG: helix-turn-helix domain-containing protein [Dietzia sp.]
MVARVAVLRERRGWSQTELARRAKVTRQLVGTVESGAHAPRVDAALRLASALGVTVEELFAAADEAHTDLYRLDDSPLSTVVGADVGERTVVVGAGRDQPWLDLVDAVVGEGGVSWLPGSERSGVVIAGCDPALGMIAALLLRRSGHRAVVVHATSATAGQWLREGVVHVAVIHGPAGFIPAVESSSQCYLLARWQVGLASSPTSSVPSIAELCDRDMPVVHRDSGAATEKSYERAVRAVGAEGPPVGPVASGHLDAVARVRHGAPAAVTTEPAALSEGLAFAGFDEHDVYLCVAAQFADHPAVIALIDLLGDRALTSRLGVIRGYDISQIGHQPTSSSGP